MKNFWDRVEKGDGCWRWTGKPSSAGYGRVGVGKRRVVFAHRRAWELTHGPVPDGMCVLHRCDNPICVRPDHLFLGTRGDNARDMASKGRAHLQRRPHAMAGDKHWSRQKPTLVRRGEDHHQAKLAAADAVAIRNAFADGATHAALAAQYGVSEGTIGFIVKGTTWKHAGGPVFPSGRGAGASR